MPTISQDPQRQPDLLRLATHDRKFNGPIDWNHPFEDIEDIVSLHRWHWLVYELSRGNGQFAALKNWGSLHIDSWVHTTFPFDDKLIWEPYTVAERLVSWILFVHLTQSSWPESWNNAFEQNIRFLVDHFEYKGRYTGNHVFNNARAVYIAGCAFNRADWRDFAQEVLRDEAKRLLTADGFLNDGSSHYQFLFTRWLLELLYFAQLTKDEVFLQWVKPLAAKAVERCWFFLVFDEKQDRVDLPLIGDISPDCVPEWLTSLVWSKTARSVFEPKRPAPKMGYPQWGNLFNFDGQGNVKQPFEIETYQQSGWHRVNHKDLTLFWHLEQDVRNKRYSHAHTDQGGFCLFKEGAAVLIDSGLYHYNIGSPQWSYGVSALAHNSILINGKGVYPTLRRRFPERFALPETNFVVTKHENRLEAVLTYSGYEQTGQNVHICRTFDISQKTLVITDYLESILEADISLMFHWGPGIVCEAFRENAFMARLGEHCIKGNIRLDGDKHARLFVHKAAPLGLCHKAYGHQESIETLQATVYAKLPCCIQTTLTWEK